MKSAVAVAAGGAIGYMLANQFVPSIGNAWADEAVNIAGGLVVGLLVHRFVK